MPLNKRYRYIAFFDLDRTILSVNSATFLVKESLKRGMMSKRQYRHAIFLSILHKLDWRDTTKILNQMLGWLDGLSRIEVEGLCEDVWNNSLKQLIRPEILSEFERHRKNDAALVLLSSATSFICLPATGHLTMDDLICSFIHDNNGILTGIPVGKLVFGKEKKNRLLSYCKDEDYFPEEAFYYGDSISDLHVLEAVGHPVCVAPDKKLIKIAIKRKWNILSTQS